MRIIIADDQKHTRRGLRVLRSTIVHDAEIWEAVTGFQAEALEAGADGFVSKGDPPDRLLARIRLLPAAGPEMLP